MDVREGPAVFRASKTLGLISGSLISLALDPAAGMKLDAAPSFRPKAVGVWQREGSGLAYGPVGGNTIRNRTGGLIKASVLSGTYHVPDIACKHMTIPTATPRNRLLSCCTEEETEAGTSPRSYIRWVGASGFQSWQSGSRACTHPSLVMCGLGVESGVPGGCWR